MASRRGPAATKRPRINLKADDLRGRYPHWKAAIHRQRARTACEIPKQSGTASISANERCENDATYRCDSHSIRILGSGCTYNPPG